MLLEKFTKIMRIHLVLLLRVILAPAAQILAAAKQIQAHNIPILPSGLVQIHPSQIIIQAGFLAILVKILASISSKVLAVAFILPRKVQAQKITPLRTLQVNNLLSKAHLSHNLRAVSPVPTKNPPKSHLNQQLTLVSKLQRYKSVAILRLIKPELRPLQILKTPLKQTFLVLKSPILACLKQTVQAIKTLQLLKKILAFLAQIRTKIQD
ncbi:MAG: hypothetical protein ACKO96_46555 [Flammeovirgaceae bacterium]